MRRRLLAALLALAQVFSYATIAGFILAPIPALAATCATPGNDDPAPSGTNVVVNDYWPGNGNVAAGATSIPVGTQDTNGAGATVGSGDLLLIVQIQDATINTSNTSAYGSGGTSGSGQSALNSAGLYEYVKATGPISGGNLPITGTGTGGGTLNAYHEAAATATTGQKTFEVVRVPQYTTLPSGTTYAPIPWNGKDGGVLAVDAASSISNITFDASGYGFRGGGVYSTATLPNGSTNSPTDYLAAYNSLSHGTKGEGIAGTPIYLYGLVGLNDVWSQSPATIGYPSGTGDGSLARGAPGNAGGGGTDNDPALNDKNTGGGGGGNGGAGGNGGYGWTSGGAPVTTNTAAGGAAETAAVTLLYMGGGGGAGVNNDGTGPTDTNGALIGSSGAPGGGLVFVRVAGVGSGVTLKANGSAGVQADHDGGGGGGAGGTIEISSNNTISGGITATASGGAGGNAWATQAPGALDTGGTYYANEHGPGGGGAGGVVLHSTTVTATATETGGPNGITTTSSLAYGATPGSAGTTGSIVYSQIPGVASGSECLTATSIYNGPVDAGEATYFGANETGSYDGVVNATNSNDFTAREIVLTGANPAPQNNSNQPGSPLGNTVSVTGASVNVPSMLYYSGTTSAKTITLTATSPAGWTAKVCADANGITTTPTVPSASCSLNVTCPIGTTTSVWMSETGSSTAKLCAAKNVATASVYWVEYSIGSTTLTSFSRLDATISSSDGTISNVTHDELYDGFIPLTKNVAVVSNGCPSGVSPTYGALGVCSGGVLRYTIDYRNIMAGGGLGTEGAAYSAFTLSQAGSLVITDDGTLSSVSQGATPNWATFANPSTGFYAQLQAGLGTSGNINCGSGTNACGDSTAGTTFQYATGIPRGAFSSTFSTAATAWQAVIGGATFQLYPPSTGHPSQGTITFAIVVK